MLSVLVVIFCRYGDYTLGTSPLFTPATEGRATPHVSSMLFEASQSPSL